MSDLLKLNSVAPEFAAKNNKGEIANLSDYKGKKNVLLVFYPMNNTPG